MICIGRRWVGDLNLEAVYVWFLSIVGRRTFFGVVVYSQVETFSRSSRTRNWEHAYIVPVIRGSVIKQQGRPLWIGRSSWMGRCEMEGGNCDRRASVSVCTYRSPALYFGEPRAGGVQQMFMLDKFILNVSPSRDWFKINYVQFSRRVLVPGMIARLRLLLFLLLRGSFKIHVRKYSDSADVYDSSCPETINLSTFQREDRRLHLRVHVLHR